MAHAILMREMELLKAQKLPKFPLVDRVLRTFSIDKETKHRLCRSLRITQIQIWNKYDDGAMNYSDVASKVTNFLHSETTQSLILYTVKTKIENALSEEKLKDLAMVVLLDFSKFSIRSLSRIIALMVNLETEYRSDDLLIVSTVDGRLCAVDLFLGIIVWSFKAGPPLFTSKNDPEILYSNPITAGIITYNSRRLLPTPGGALYTLGYDSFPYRLEISIDQLFSPCTYIGDVLFTGSKLTNVNKLSLPVGYTNRNNSQKILKKMENAINLHPKIPLLLKSTTRTLKANQRSSMKTKWSFTVTEYEININDDGSCEADAESSSAMNLIKVDPPKGVILRKINPQFSEHNFVWQIKLKSSIADVWILENRRLQKFDLFSSPHAICMGPNSPTIFCVCTSPIVNFKYVRESPQLKVQLPVEPNLDSILNAHIDQRLHSQYHYVTGCKEKGFYVYPTENTTTPTEKPLVNHIDDKDIHRVDKFESEFSKSFKYIKLLGDGGFGSVVKVSHVHAKFEYAIKRIKFNKKKDQIKQISREVEAQAILDHVNVVRYHHSWLEEPPLNWDDPLESELECSQSSSESLQPGSFPTSYDSSSSNAYFYIQMQLCNEGNLRDWLNKHTKLEERIKPYVSYFKQIISGVEYIHEKGFIHRDLKPENIFFYTKEDIKIGDFGLTTNIIDPLIDDIEIKFTKKLEHTLNVGTSFYIAPEQKLTKTYDNKVDIWALGVILVEFLSVFKTGSERIKVLENLHIGTFGQNLIESFPDEYKLLRLMLSHDPTKRPTTFGIRAHSPINDETVDERFYFRMPSKDDR